MNQENSRSLKSAASDDAFLQCPQCKAFYERNISFCTADGTKLEEANGEVESDKTKAPFAGKYEILDEIGSGGMGAVYRARQILLDKICALKVIPAESLNDVLISRFQHEAKTMAALDHENLGRVLDFGIYQNQPFMVMEFLDGIPLNKLISQDTLSIEETIEIFAQVLNALSHAHKKGVLHRDIKPSNIMIMQPRNGDSARKAILLDFGIAKKLDDDDFDSSKAQALTRTGEMIGSPLYMSPEQARGEKLTERSDLYSLGCALFECLTGTVPFIGNSTVDTLIMHMEKPAPTLKEASLGKDFPAGLERVVRKLLCKDPGERYQSAEETKRALALSLKLNDDDVEEKAACASTAASRTVLILAAMALVMVVSLIAYVSTQGVKTADKKVTDEDKIGLANTFLSVVDSAFSDKQQDGLKEAEADYAPVHFTPPREKRKLYVPITGRESSLALRDQTLEQKRVELIEQDKNLRRLGLMNARFPHSMLGNLSGSVEILRLTETGLKDEDIKLIIKNRHLKELSLNSNPLTDRGIRQLSSLKFLHLLDLASTRCGAHGISELHALPLLDTLYLSNSNHIDDKAAEAVSHLPALVELSLNNTKVTGKGIAHLSRIPHLSNLMLNELNLGNDEITQLKDCPSLTTLHLSDNMLTSMGVKHLLGIKKLHKLVLADNPIDDKAVDTLLQMSGLRYLNLSGTKLTREGIMRLAALPHLKDIHVRRINGLDEGDAHNFLTRCKTCREFVFLINKGSGYKRSEWLLDEKSKPERQKAADTQEE